MSQIKKYDITNSLDQSGLDLCLRLRGELDRLVGGWLTGLTRVFSLLHRSDYLNTSSVEASLQCLLISSENLTLTLAKLLIYGLASHFPTGSIYTFAKKDRSACFEQITSRFGERAVYILIGNTPEEKDSAAQLKWPFWCLAGHSDLHNLVFSIEMGFL
ncbi:unnamed protein product [Mesocestoides corti]|uniref:Eyes absent homolog n=1 Tax=Mesocestoides corti TaxID=53468 RepID=A0A0R3U157_MESCO|nr:unnamed protein product [Mesocestoides corti]